MGWKAIKSSPKDDTQYEGKDGYALVDRGTIKRLQDAVRTLVAMNRDRMTKEQIEDFLELTEIERG